MVIFGAAENETPIGLGEGVGEVLTPTVIDGITTTGDGEEETEGKEQNFVKWLKGNPFFDPNPSSFEA